MVTNDKHILYNVWAIYKWSYRTQENQGLAVQTPVSLTLAYCKFSCTSFPTSNLTLFNTIFYKHSVQPCKLLFAKFWTKQTRIRTQIKIAGQILTQGVVETCWFWTIHPRFFFHNGKSHSHLSEYLLRSLKLFIFFVCIFLNLLCLK